MPKSIFKFKVHLFTAKYKVTIVFYLNIAYLM